MRAAIVGLGAWGQRLVNSVQVSDLHSIHCRCDANGASGYLSTVLSSAHFWRLHFLGTRGWTELRDERFLTACETAGTPSAIEYPENDSVRAALAAFAAAPAGGAPYPVTGEEAVSSAAAIEAVVRSAATKAEVVLA